MVGLLFIKIVNYLMKSVQKKSPRRDQEDLFRKFLISSAAIPNSRVILISFTHSSSNSSSLVFAFIIFRRPPLWE